MFASPPGSTQRKSKSSISAFFMLFLDISQNAQLFICRPLPLTTEDVWYEFGTESHSVSPIWYSNC